VVCIAHAELSPKLNFLSPSKIARLHTMNRRHLLLALPVLVLTSAIAKAQASTLAVAFAELPPAARRAAQEQLALGGLYDGRIDGAYGPRTQAALVSAAQFITDNSNGRTSIDLNSSGGAQSYLNALARGEFAKYLWGEGDENASG
jgi:hypothetical protein